MGHPGKCPVTNVPPPKASAAHSACTSAQHSHLDWVFLQNDGLSPPYWHLLRDLHSVLLHKGHLPSGNLYHL